MDKKRLRNVGRIVYMALLKSLEKWDINHEQLTGLRYKL